VRTLFRMPDLFSLALGGGSIVSPDPLAVGPHSVGYRLTEAALVFGGRLAWWRYDDDDLRLRRGSGGRAEDAAEDASRCSTPRSRGWRVTRSPGSAPRLPLAASTPRSI
jgi:hypothetical protein